MVAETSPFFLRFHPNFLTAQLMSSFPAPLQRGKHACKLLQTNWGKGAQVFGTEVGAGCRSLAETLDHEERLTHLQQFYPEDATGAIGCIC